jgi:hypothetical protein
MSFFPKVVKFFDFFSQQNELLVDSASTLNDLFNDYTGISEKCGKIAKNETAGDDISREISKALALTFITPIDREDIHAVNLAQEDALNSIRAISTRIGLYHFTQVKPGARDLIKQLLLMHQEISKMIEGLKTRKGSEEHALKVKEMMIHADMLLLLSMGEIYENQPEGSGDFMDLIKWSHIYDRIEEALAKAEILANVTEGVSLKNA